VRTVEGMCYQNDEPRSVWMFITAGPITKLFALGEGTVEDMCYEIRRAAACVD
jgi:hypothetical protein